MAEHAVRFPNESDEYRRARNALLDAELELRDRIEAVAALRRKLPPGGPVREDYVFEEDDGTAVRQVPLSALFEPGKDSLVIYSYMFGPDDEQPCPMCTSLIDGFNGSARHITQRVNFVVVAKSPAPRLRARAEGRGWHDVRLLSSHGNTYNADYHAETPGGMQLPACNVFTKTPEGIRHFYSTEMLYLPAKEGGRHVDLLWPLWNVLDLTPEGRGTDWMPKLDYEAEPAAGEARRGS